MVSYTILVAPPGLFLAWLTGSRVLLYRLAVPLARLVLWLGGVRIRVHGVDRLDPAQNYLFMPNHNSNADPPVVVIALRREPCFMAKASLFRIPLFGQVLSSAGFVAVEREKRDAAITAVSEAAQRLRDGYDFVVFPEGTRSRDGQLLALKKGPFFMAVNSSAPVVPVRVSGTRDILPKGGMLIRGGPVEVEVCEPIVVGMFDGSPEERRRRLRDHVAATLRGDLTGSSTCVTPEDHGQA